MHLQIRTSQHRTTVAIAGELDLTTHEHLSDAFTCLRLWDTPDVEVDLGLVTFVDVGSLRILHDEQQRHAALHRSFRIVDVSPAFALVAHVARYDQLVPETHPAAGLSAAPEEPASS